MDNTYVGRNDTFPTKAFYERDALQDKLVQFKRRAWMGVVLTTAGVALFGGVMFRLGENQNPDVFSQKNFPCQEDEALMFDPYFGPEHVGCIPVNQVIP